MHQRFAGDSMTNRPARAMRQFGLRVLGSVFLTRRALPVCLLLALCLRHAVASISV
jgi:hypothetical protein